MFRLFCCSSYLLSLCFCPFLASPPSVVAAILQLSNGQLGKEGQIIFGQWDGSAGSGKLLNDPSGISCNGSVLYVVDSGNRRILEWREGKEVVEVLRNPAEESCGYLTASRAVF